MQEKKWKKKKESDMLSCIENIFFIIKNNMIQWRIPVNKT